MTIALSPEALSIPANVDLRFRCLIHTYRIRVVDPSISTITSLDDGPADPSQVSGSR